MVHMLSDNVKLVVVTEHCFFSIFYLTFAACYWVWVRNSSTVIVNHGSMQHGVTF